MGDEGCELIPDPLNSHASLGPCHIHVMRVPSYVLQSLGLSGLLTNFSSVTALFRHRLDPSLSTSEDAHLSLDQICFPGSCILEQSLAWHAALEA